MIANIAHLQGNSNNWADGLGILRECTLGSYDLEVLHQGRDSITNPCDDVDGINPDHLLYEQYIPSVYWAMTVLTTTGYGDITPANTNEKIFTIFVFIIGTVVCANVMIHLQEIVALLDVTSAIRVRRENKMQSFLSRELSIKEVTTVEGSISSLVSKYFERLWFIQKGASPSEIKAFLCPRIYSLSIMRAIERSFDNMFYMKKAPTTFRNKLCSKMTMNVYVAGEYIFHTNELARKLFILFDGEISLVDDETLKEKRDNEDGDFQRFSNVKHSKTKAAYIFNRRNNSQHSISRYTTTNLPLIILTTSTADKRGDSSIALVALVQPVPLALPVLQVEAVLAPRRPKPMAHMALPPKRYPVS